MGIPKGTLTAGEQVRKHLHPHWKMLIRPALWAALALGILITGAIYLSLASLGGILVTLMALTVFLWLATWPYLVWRATSFVVTNERVIACKGVVKHHMEDIPLARVNGMSTARTFMDRLIGNGTLTIVSGDNHVLVLKDIVGSVRLQREIHEWLEASKAKTAGADADD